MPPGKARAVLGLKAKGARSRRLLSGDLPEQVDKIKAEALRAKGKSQLIDGRARQGKKAHQASWGKLEEVSPGKFAQKVVYSPRVSLI